MLNGWLVACGDHVAVSLGVVIHVSKIGSVNIPGTDSHYPYAFHVFIPTSASSFTMFHRGDSYLLCNWATALNLTRAAKRLFPSAGSPFPCCHSLSRDPRVCRLGATADIRTGPFQYNFNWSPYDCRIWQVVIKTSRSRCFNLFHSSHWLTCGCQKT